MSKIVLARVLVVVLFLPVMTWVAVSRIAGEVRSIPKYVWRDWCAEIEAMAAFWRTGQLTSRRR